MTTAGIRLECIGGAHDGAVVRMTIQLIQGDIVAWVFEEPQACYRAQIAWPDAGWNVLYYVGKEFDD